MPPFRDRFEWFEWSKLLHGAEEILRDEDAVEEAMGFKDIVEMSAERGVVSSSCAL